MHQGDDTWVFTGDTGRNPLLWQFVSQLPRQGRSLRWLVTECTFADDDQAFADLTGHYTAHSLAQDLDEHLHSGGIELYLSHLKPCDKAAIVRSISYSRAGVMPAWQGRLDPAIVNMLTVYVHSLGGGE